MKKEKLSALTEAFAENYTPDELLEASINSIVHDMAIQNVAKKLLELNLDINLIEKSYRFNI